jgi:hypothetical protein
MVWSAQDCPKTGTRPRSWSLSGPVSTASQDWTGPTGLVFGLCEIPKDRTRPDHRISIDEQTEPDAEGKDNPTWNISTGCTSTTNGASWTHGTSSNSSTSFNGYMQPQTELWNTPEIGFTPLSGHHAAIVLSSASNIPS